MQMVSAQGFVSVLEGYDLKTPEVTALLELSRVGSGLQIKANSMLGIFRKGIENKTSNIIMLLHLEYCVHVWSPRHTHTQKEVEMERFQKWATEMIKGLEHLPFEKMLQNLGLFPSGKRQAVHDRDFFAQDMEFASVM